MTQSMMRSRKLTLVLGMVIALVALAPRPALGCSCMPPDDLGAMIDNAPAAFVGVMVDRKRGADQFEAVFVFEVDEWVKSDLGSQVAIHSGSDSAMCGFENPTGDLVGLLVYNDGPRLTSGLCSMVSPDGLLEVASGHTPRPGAVPPLLPEDIGLPGTGPTTGGNTTAQVALGVLAGLVLAALVVARLRRPGSAPEE